MEVSRDKRNCDGDEEEERKRRTGENQEKTSLHRRSTAMERRTYTEIERALKHSLTAIKRYILTFSRVAYLTEKGYTTKEIVFSSRSQSD